MPFMPLWAPRRARSQLQLLLLNTWGRKLGNKRVPIKCHRELIEAFHLRENVHRQHIDKKVAGDVEGLKRSASVEHDGGERLRGCWRRDRAGGEWSSHKRYWLSGKKHWLRLSRRWAIQGKCTSIWVSSFWIKVCQTLSCYLERGCSGLRAELVKVAVMRAGDDGYGGLEWLLWKWVFWFLIIFKIN